MGKTQAEKEEGKSIMSKFQEQVSSNPLIKDKLIDPKNIASDCLPSLPAKMIPLRPVHRRLNTTAI